MTFIDTWDSGQPNGLWDVGIQWDVNSPSPGGDPTPYLNLVTSEHRDQPDFIATLTAVLQPFADLQTVMSSFPTLFDIDVAVGVQEDAVGKWVGVSRNLNEPLTGVYFELDSATLGLDQGILQGPFDPTSGIVQLPDDVYRQLLQAEVLNNSWDGTVTEAYAIWKTLFPDTLPSLVPTELVDFTTNYVNGVVYPSSEAVFSRAELTLTRNGPATYTDSFGLLVTAAANVPRFNYVGGVAVGILLEGASTNNFTYSNDFSNAAWTLSDPTLSQNALGPDGGSSSAWTATAASFAANRAYRSDNIASSQTISFYVEAGTCGFAYIWAIESGGGQIGTWFNLLAGVKGTNNYTITGSPVGSFSNVTITPAANGFYRISAYYNYVSGTVSAGWGFSDSDASNAATIGHTGIIFGAQMESLQYASSYIPTTTAAASRVADSITRTRSSPTAFTRLVSGITPAGLPSAGSAFWTLDDGTTSNIIFAYYTPAGHIEVLANIGGTTVVALDMGAVAFNAAFSLAVTASAGNFAASLNGGAVVSSSYGTMPTGLINDWIGEAFSAGNYPLNSNLGVFAEWTGVVMTNAQLQALAAPGGAAALEASWVVGPELLIQDESNMHMILALTGTPPSPLDLALFLSGSLNVRPDGVQIDYYLTPDTSGDPYFGLDIENANIAGLDVGGFGFLNNGTGY